MEKSVKHKIALHAPNLVNICIDANENGIMSGRLYHCYAEEPWTFENVVQMIGIMENFFDNICYPQASTQIRNFKCNKMKDCVALEKVKTQDEIIKYRGCLGTFFTHVQYRQNSSWQGEVEWAEKGIVKCFQSELDFMKLLNGAMQR